MTVLNSIKKCHLFFWLREVDISYIIWATSVPSFRVVPCCGSEQAQPVWEPTAGLQGHSCDSRDTGVGWQEAMLNLGQRPANNTTMLVSNQKIWRGKRKIFFNNTEKKMKGRLMLSLSWIGGCWEDRFFNGFNLRLGRKAKCDLNREKVELMLGREVESNGLWKQPNKSKFPGSSSSGLNHGRVTETLHKTQLNIHLPPSR